MKILRVLVITILALIFFNCTKKEKNYTIKEVNGVKIIKNSATPSDPNFRITPKKIFTINGFDDQVSDSTRNMYSLCDIREDRAGDLYVLDYKKCQIKKFSRDGKFIKSFSKEGDGPGEMRGAYEIFFLDDTLYVTDFTKMEYSVFDTDGNYLKRIETNRHKILQRQQEITGKRVIANNFIWKGSKSGATIFSHEFNLWDHNFKKLATIIKDSTEYIAGKTSLHDYIYSTYVGKNSIYIAENSTDIYRIYVYDFDLNKRYIIEKQFRKIPLSDDELKEYNRVNEELMKDNSRLDFNYKKAICYSAMYEDKDGNLIVNVTLPRDSTNVNDFVVDAFKDGVFLNRFKMDIGKGMDLYDENYKRYFVGNRIYSLSELDHKIDVYEY